MKRVNRRVFITSVAAVALLLIPSFIAAFAEDEGTLGDGVAGHIFAKVFTVLRFPLHTLFWGVISWTDSAFVFFGSMFLNCCFWGLLIERIIAAFYSGGKTATRQKWKS